MQENNDMFYLNSLSSGEFIAGVDEVGRGPLAGPVVASCCCLKIKSKDLFISSDFESKFNNFGIQDSKKLSAKKRLKVLEEFNLPLNELKSFQLYSLLESDSYSLTMSIAEISNTSIDELNILNASLMAMEKAFEICFRGEEGRLLIDGNKNLKKQFEGVKSETLIKGDSRSQLIALSSIIAKEYRDYLMKNHYSKIYPGYGFEGHSGYPTKLHKEALEKLGPSQIHRKSFRGVKEFL